LGFLYDKLIRSELYGGHNGYFCLSVIKHHKSALLRRYAHAYGESYTFLVSRHSRQHRKRGIFFYGAAYFAYQEISLQSRPFFSSDPFGFFFHNNLSSPRSYTHALRFFSLINDHTTKQFYFN
jgi:hypothetical protein